MRHLIIAVLVASWLATPKTFSAENVFLVTLDGLRWQELFTGADAELMGDEKFVRSPDALAEKFWRETPAQRRHALMPFMWSTVVDSGVIYGNRALGSRVEVKTVSGFPTPDTTKY